MRAQSATSNMLWFDEETEDDKRIVAPIFGENLGWEGSWKRRPIVCAAYRVAAFVATLFQRVSVFVRHAKRR